MQENCFLIKGKEARMISLRNVQGVIIETESSPFKIPTRAVRKSVLVDKMEVSIHATCATIIRSQSVRKMKPTVTTRQEHLPLQTLFASHDIAKIRESTRKIRFEHNVVGQSPL